MGSSPTTRTSPGTAASTPRRVREYYQILCDTLLGRMVLPYRKRQDRRVLSRTPKFFLFDVGVAGALVKRRIAEAAR